MTCDSGPKNPGRYTREPDLALTHPNCVIPNSYSVFRSQCPHLYFEGLGGGEVKLLPLHCLYSCQASFPVTVSETQFHVSACARQSETLDTNSISIALARRGGNMNN